jgi:hypothetical protein
VAAVGPVAAGARWAALAAFLTFFAVSWTKALVGEETCSCLSNRVPINPRWMAILDLAAILALWRWQPPEREGQSAGSRRLRLAVVLFLCLLLGASSGSIAFVSRPTALNNPISHDGAGDKALLVSLPGNLDLGVVPAGDRAEARFSLSNPGANAVKVGEITTSCGCFRVVLSNTVIGPGESTEATALLDLAEEPAFVGTLRLTAAAGAEEKVPAFVVHAKVMVEKRQAE